MKLHLILEARDAALLDAQLLHTRPYRLSGLPPLGAGDRARGWCMVELLPPAQEVLGWVSQLRQAHPLMAIVVSAEDRALAPRAYAAGADVFLSHNPLREELVAVARAQVRHLRLCREVITSVCRPGPA